MENFLLAFNVVFPIFLIMMLGVILKRKNMVDDKSLNVMNSLIFRLFMPTLLFSDREVLHSLQHIHNKTIR